LAKKPLINSKISPNRPNKYQKHKGRPATFSDPKQLESLGNQFFEQCDLDQKPYTITGLALALGFNSRQALVQYEDKPKFISIIKKLKARCERFWESRLNDSACTGSIFWLKNFGWSDRQEVDHSGYISIASSSSTDIKKRTKSDDK